jgi:hypothetical protein
MENKGREKKEVREVSQQTPFFPPSSEEFAKVI